MSEWKEPTNAAEELLCAVPSLLTDHPWVRDAIVQLRAHAAALERIAELEAENAKLKSAIRWALGYDEGDPQFGEQQDGRGMYSWRTELSRRAGFQAFRAEFKEVK